MSAAPFCCADCGRFADLPTVPCAGCGSLRVIASIIPAAAFGPNWWERCFGKPPPVLQPGGRQALFSELTADPLTSAQEILDRACQEEDVRQLYACLTGGDDSLATAEVTSRHRHFAGCFHIRTGIGVPEATEHVRLTCRQRGWPLFEHDPPARQYDDLVLEYGFPGPAAHRFMYSWLKERAVRAFVRDRKAGGRVGLVTGVRRAESRRRMGTAQPILREGSRVWIAPLLYWDSLDTRALLTERRIERSPVKCALGISGECLCGSFAAADELDRIALHFPATADRIDCLMERARRAGVHAEWGVSPPRVSDYGAREAQGQRVLCSSCEFRGTK